MKSPIINGVSLLVAIGVILVVRSQIVSQANPPDSPSQQQSSGATDPRPEPELPAGCKIKQWNSVDDFNLNLAQFETVFWDPRDTISLRKLIHQSGLVKGRAVMEIGTGSGLLGLCCLKAGASRVVVTDVNESAVANANFNAEWLGLERGLDVRLVSIKDSGAFTTLKPDEKFDLIISNPPWVNQKPKSIDEFALYDENFALMRSLFDGVEERLNPGGRVWLAYGCVDAIRTIEKLAREHDFEFEILDDRNLDDLPEEFLPGMLIEVRP